LVTVQQHHIFGRSARLTYTGYTAPDRLPKSAAPLNGYRTTRMPASCISGAPLPALNPRREETGIAVIK